MVNWSAGEYTVGTIAPYGVVIGMTSDNGGGETVLWKPESEEYLLAEISFSIPEYLSELPDDPDGQISGVS